MAKKDSATTKKFVDIEEVKDKSILLRDGSLRGIVEVGSINFDLKSASEQTAVIEFFQNFLNSLDFSLQIAVVSRKMDIGNYLKIIEQKKEIEQNELMRIQMTDYIRFIQGLTELSNIMTKKFYVVVPYHIQELGVEKQGLMEGFRSLFTPSKAAKKLDPEKFNEYQRQLLQRVDVVVGGLGALGLNPRILEEKELKLVVAGLYNPEAKEIK
jgi:type IV secretory pathway VirB4 component